MSRRHHRDGPPLLEQTLRQRAAARYFVTSMTCLWRAERSGDLVAIARELANIDRARAHARSTGLSMDNITFPIEGRLR